MNRRRQIALGLAAALMGSATRLRAQSSTGAVRRVGVLLSGSQAASRAAGGPFREEMARLGWVEGRTVVYDYAAAEGQLAMLPQRATELVARRPDAILLGEVPAALAAKQATTTIPIVFYGIATPVEEGVVSSLARPGGNVTGVSPNLERLLPKRVELLRDIQPKLKRIGILRPPVDPVLDKVVARLESALLPIGVTVVGADVADAAGIESAVSRLASARVEAIIDAMTSGVTLNNRERLIELTNRARLPYVATWPVGADAGALFSYGGRPLQRFVPWRGSWTGFFAARTPVTFR